LDESLIESSVISKTQSELPMTTVSSSLGPSTHTFSVSRSSITGENGGYGHYSHGGGFSPDGADDEADLVEDE
jgi:peptidoglycan hydrolase-like amidase